MMAETRRPESYLSSEKVSSYHIGCDDFYEGRAAIQARVPAYSKVRWDKSQMPIEHQNDAQTNPRMVKTIFFDSGPDGALATAVYVKFREVRLREIAKNWAKISTVFLCRPGWRSPASPWLPDPKAPDPISRMRSME